MRSVGPPLSTPDTRNYTHEASTVPGEALEKQARRGVGTSPDLDLGGGRVDRGKHQEKCRGGIWREVRRGASVVIGCGAKEGARVNGRS